MKRSVFFTVLLIIAFVISYFASKILYSFNPNWATFLPNNPFFWELSWLVLRLVPVILVAALLSEKRILIDLGLVSNFWLALLYSIIFTAPLFIGFALFGKLNTNINTIKIVSNCLVPGFYEELLIRSFLIGFLYKHFKWGFFPAAIFGAVFFGAWHIYQGHNFLSSFFAFLTTAAGSIWFAWLYLEWRSNAWINILLHILMNLSWLLFSVEGGAAGTTLANVLRLCTVALSVLVTIQLQSKRKGFIVNRQTFWVNRQ